MDLPISDYQNPDYPNHKILDEDIIIIFDHEKEEYIKIPKNFFFDGASIPSFFRKIFGGPYDKKNLHASLVHDYLYNLAYDGKLTRLDSDYYFRECLTKNGHDIFSSYVMWSGVRMFGWWCYKKNYQIDSRDRSNMKENLVDTYRRTDDIFFVVVTGVFLIIFFVYMFNF